MKFPMICKMIEGTPAQMDLASYHLSQRTVFFSGQVDSASADLLVQELLYLCNKSQEPIVMYINSPGGEVASGLGIWDTMQHIKKHCPLITCCNGQAASFAALLLAAGSKRYIVPNGDVMLHQPSILGTGGRAVDMDITARHIMAQRDRLADLLAQVTHQPKEKVVEDMSRGDLWLSAEDALAYGLCDVIGLPDLTEV